MGATGILFAIFQYSNLYMILDPTTSLGDGLIIDYDFIVGLIFSYNITHIYSLTLLYNLNIRKKLRNMEHTLVTGSNFMLPSSENHISEQECSSSGAGAEMA